ncbi:HK97 gp10 family phage protein [Bacillus shackletonii]|nr:HK97 gp10 family phage protein [Heyndrickxia shackletonii]
MAALIRTIRQLEELPQKCVTKAARKGATVALKATRNSAPVDKGDLKRGIVLKGEKSRIRGKKMYQVTFDRGYNHVFVKQSADGTKRYYYPASQEYGYIARDGSYVPGYHFMRNSVDEHKTEIERTTVQVLASEIDKIR